MAYHLAIDLGTTYTAAAVRHNGRSEIVTLGNRAAVIPSVIYLREDETILAGDAANRRALTEPGRVARQFKRRIGDPTPFILGGSPYSAEALSARLMTWVIDRVTGLEGGPADSVVVTHPANWGEYKKDLLRQAVRLSGLSEAGYITEPEAAAIYYSSLERVEQGMVVAVYDLGGGTFDAVLLRKTDDVGYEILGEPEGIERLGGIDFDEAVFQHVATSLDGAIDELDPEDPATLAAVGRLREECVAAKEALSGDTDASIPVLLPNISTEVRITRPEFEAMIRPPLADTLSAMGRAIDSASMQPGEVDKILLVGGSSRIPLVGQLVAAEFDRPIAVDAQPKHAIVLGAAAVAGALSDDEEVAPASIGDVGVSGTATAAPLDPAAVEVEVSESSETPVTPEAEPAEAMIEGETGVATPEFEPPETVESAAAAPSLTEPPPVAAPEEEPKAPGRRPSRTLLVGAGAAAVVAVVAIGLALTVFSGNGDDVTQPLTAAPTGEEPAATAPADENPEPTALADESPVTTTPVGVGSVTAAPTDDPFVTWTLTTVDDEGGTGVRPSMVIGAEGSQMIAYYNPTFEDLRFALCRDPACVAVAKSVIDQGNVGDWPSIALGADGLPVVSYYDRGMGDLKVARCTDPACTSATISVVDSEGNVGSYSSIAIGADGLPIISYFDESNADLKAAHCDVPDCTSVTVFTVDDVGEVGSDTAITIGSDGLPVISYNDKGKVQLKLAHCETFDCSAATTASVDIGGIGTSIAIGSEGFPIISYGVLNPNQVRLAQCSDVACARANIVIVEDAAPGVTCQRPRCMGGSETSVAVDGDGVPHVSYHHDIDGLRMARCNDTSCAVIAAYPVDTHLEAGIDSSIGIHPSGILSIAYFSGEDGSLKAATTGQ